VEGPRCHVDDSVEVGVVVLSGNVLTFTDRKTAFGKEGAIPEVAIKYLKSLKGYTFPLKIYKTARFTENGQVLNVGDWAAAQYMMTNKNKSRNESFPFELMGCFETGTGDATKTLAVGRMATGSKESSKLLTRWNMEKGLRIIDMEIMAESLFVLSVPDVCCLPSGPNVGLNRNHILVIKDRVQEWPTIFNKTNWKMIDRLSEDKKKKGSSRQEKKGAAKKRKQSETGKKGAGSRKKQRRSQ
jgi:hypothetical protein